MVMRRLMISSIIGFRVTAGNGIRSSYLLYCAALKPQHTMGVARAGYINRNTGRGRRGTVLASEDRVKIVFVLLFVAF